MAWTTPGTAVAGEVLTAAFWNEQVRDNSDYLKAEADAVGLVLITAADFSAASTVDITGVFSASYINYQIHISNEGSANDTSISARLISGVTPDTSNTYDSVYVSGNVTAPFSGAASTTSFSVVGLSDDDGTARCNNVFHIFSPFTTSRETTMQVFAYSSTRVNRFGAGVYKGTTSFDGFQVFPTSGTLTGRYWVYGIRST